MTNTALVNLVRSLVGIDSVNPSLVPGGAGEREAARWVERWCREREIETTWLEGTPGRPSVVARIHGTGGGRSLMLNAHLDTVGVDAMEAPFAARVEGGRLHGRGSMDMKASVAACLIALERLQDAELRGDLLFTAVADEEHASIGTIEVLERFHADAAIVTEPSGLDLHVAHRGFVVVEVVVRGVASHTSQPERGANAVAAAGRLLGGVAAHAEALRDRPPHPRLGHGAIQPVLISGGRELFVTPDQCRLSLERRTLPGEDVATVVSEVEGLVQAAIATDGRSRADVEVVVARDPFEVDDAEPIVRDVGSALRERIGRPPALIGAPYWMDAALIAARGIPTVVVGPLGGGAHAADEWVDLESVGVLADVLVDVAEAWCR